MIAKQVHLAALLAALGCLVASDHARAQLPAESYQPGQTYSALDAARESHEYAEQGRRDAIARQMELVEYARQPRVPVAAVGVVAVPATPGAARRAARRAYAQPLRYPYWPGYGVVVGVSPRPALPYVGVMPYSPPVIQPRGHERIWTGPNSYIYRPVYPEPFYAAPESARQPSPPWEPGFESQDQPAVARPQTPTPAAPRIPEPPTSPLPGPQEL